MTKHALMELAERLSALPKISESGRNDDGIEGVAIPGVDCYDFDDLMKQAATQLRTAAAEGGECSKCAARDARANAIYRGPAHPDAAREHLLDRRLIAEPTDSGAGRGGWLPVESAPKGGGADYRTDPAWTDPPLILMKFPGGEISVARWEWYYAEGGCGYVEGLDAWVEPVSGEQLCLQYGTADGWQPLPPAIDTAIAGAAGEKDCG